MHDTVAPAVVPLHTECVSNQSAHRTLMQLVWLLCTQWYAVAVTLVRLQWLCRLLGHADLES